MVQLSSLLCVTPLLLLAGLAQATLGVKGVGVVARGAQVKARHMVRAPLNKAQTLKKRAPSKQNRCAKKQTTSASTTLATTSTSSIPHPTQSAGAGGGNAPQASAPEGPASTGSGNTSGSVDLPVANPPPQPAVVVPPAAPARPLSTHDAAPPPAPTHGAPPPSNPPASSSSDNSNDGSGLTSSEQQTFLELHNSIRAQHSASALTWSSQLASIAKGWADKCVFQHSHGSLGPYGENLAAGEGGGYDVTKAMQSWTDEISQYNSADPQPSHYTQVVWKGTTQVGCGLAPACDGIFPSMGPAMYFVCEYHPQGNIIGEFGENVD